MNKPWPVVVVLSAIVLSICSKTISTIYIYIDHGFLQYPQAFFRHPQFWISAVVLVVSILFGIWFFQGIKNGRNGFRIFYLVISPLSLLGAIFMLLPVIKSQTTNGTLLYLGVFSLIFSLFVLWAFIFHKPTVQFLKPQLAPAVAPSTEPIQPPQLKPSALACEPTSDATECDQELINRLKAKLQNADNTPA